MKDVYILLGSNQGDRQDFLSRAVEMINDRAGRIIKKSLIYVSDSWGFEDPVPFLNQVIEIETNLAPANLLDQLLTIEVQLGRIRPFEGCGCSIPMSIETGKDPAQEVNRAYGSRTIDLDILFYGQQMVFTDTLMVPHPRLHERRFTLVPMNEIAPEMTHPLLKKTMSMLLRDCGDRSTVTALNTADY